MKSHIANILDKIKSVKVAVYGDFCLDVYWSMDATGSEISVETGQQAEAVQKHYYSPGGAGNVVANLAALQPQCIRAIGVIGADMHGRELTAQMQALGVDTDGLIRQQTQFDTYAFTKKYQDGRELSRTDFGTHNRRSAETDQEVLRHLQAALENCDVLVFNQQVPGSITRPEFIEDANQLFAAFPDKTVLLDSRHFNRRFRHVHLKLNEIEVARLNGQEVGYQDLVSQSEVETYGREVFQLYQKPVFVTCGNQGIVAVHHEGIDKVPALQVMGKIDTVGAGDTVLSALALCLGAGFACNTAIEFANYAAAVSIRKLQTTGTASGSEILAVSEDAYFIYEPELAQNPRRATYLEGTHIELADASVPARLGRIQHAVFDHDGTISVLREGWEKIMEPLMIQAILGDQYQTADNSLYEKVRQRCAEYIDQSTGIQTIIQMEALVQMVDEFNIVPKDLILDKFGYKELYNDALLEMVNERTARFQGGELQIEDFTIKGAVDFLRALKARGVTLYLASGTDRDDVIREAEILGYADVFEGRIYGSVGDIKQYSKKMVIDKIIRDNGLSGSELVVLGDGPVEIQEGRRFGGVAVGIASDEPRRYGLSIDKRKRLIRAGAHLIVPDFSQWKQLLKLLLGDA